MAHVSPIFQSLDNGPHNDQYQRDAWLQLQSSLARTLDDLYLVCEGDTQSELIKSTLRILEETVDDFRLLASTSPAGSTATHSRSSTYAESADCSSSEQDAVHTADAAALVSRSSGACGTSCCSSNWLADASTSSTHPSKPHGSSRLSRSSSAGCNLQALGTWGAAQALSSSSSSWQHNTAAWEGAASSNPCCDDEADLEHGDSFATGFASETLHHKLSSPDRLRRSPSQTKAASEQRHARADRLREQLAEARLARVQEHLAKQQRRAASKGAEPSTSSSTSPGAVRTADKHQRSSLLRAAHLRRIRAKAEDESRKVDEVSFINNLTNAGKKADLQQRLEDGEARRAEALAAILARQQEAAANVREAAERRRLAEAERLAQLEHRQRRKEEVQAKLEEERRAAVAAREAARAHAKAVAQQREAARQQQASQLRERVTARLKQAAERRVQHLELIRERAALGKDFDRRDSFAGGSSGRQSPTSFERPAGRAARQARTPVPAATAADGARPGPAAEGLHSAGSSARADRLDIQTAVLGPAAAAAAAVATGGSCISAESSQMSLSQASTGSGVSPPAGLLPCDVFGQLQGNSQSIAAAGLVAAPSSHKQSMKGARRRMAKAKSKMQQPGRCFQESEQAQELSQSAEAQQLLAAWAPHLAVLQVQPMPQPDTATPAPAAAGTAHSTPAAAAGSSADAAPAEQQACACDVSSKSSSATNSPRSSMSSYAGASAVSTSTFSSTLVGSPASCCPAVWMLSRSSSCCDCDSQHSTNAAATCSRSRAAVEEQRREALVALVASARSHLAKQQLLVAHLARCTGLLYRLCEEVLATCSGSNACSSGGCGISGSVGAPQEAKARQERLQQARLLELLGRLLELPANLDYLLSCGQLLPAFVRSTRMALDHCNSLDADEPSMMTGGEAASRLSMLLQMLVAVLEHTPSSAELVDVQEQLVGFTIAAGLVARLASVFSLFDQPMQQAARPVPPHVLQCLRLLGGLTAVRSPPDELLPGRMWPRVAPNALAIMLEMQATSMAGVLSLLTAVLLNASPTCTPAEASSRALPPNFVEAAHLVMAVLNNVCRLDLMAGQFMLSCAHHRMEFYHLISFLLSYCLSRWPAPVSPRASAAGMPGTAAVAGVTGVACPAGQQQQLRQAQPQPQPQPQQQQTVRGPCAGCTEPPCSSSSRPAGGCAQNSSSAAVSPAKAETGRPPGVAAVLHHPIAQLLNQVLVLIGYFCVQHPSNQAMLTWGRSPSILQRLCSLPQDYLAVLELRAVLMPTLLCVCYGAERTCESVAQHFNLEELLVYVEQQQVQPQQQAGASLQDAQQLVGQTRKERRRQRRAQQRQCADGLEQQPGAEQEQQQLPLQAEQVLQQVRSCSSSAGQPCRAGNDSGSSSSNDAVGYAGGGGSSSSYGACRSTHPGGSWPVRLGLCQRFPVQVLPVAAAQLQRLLSVQKPDVSTSSNAGGSITDALQEQHAYAAANATSPLDPSDLQAHGEQPVAQQQAEPAVSGAQAGSEAVSLQLQIQRPPAAELVHCKVVACS